MLINGASMPLDQAATAIAAISQTPTILISPQPGVTAQGLADVLVALRRLAGAQLHVLG